MEVTEERPRVMFSAFEKALLLKLIDRHKDVIELKEFNKTAWSKKTEAFQKITKDFNKAPGVMRRSAQQLRQCYFNLKKRALKKKAKLAPPPSVSPQLTEEALDCLGLVDVVMEEPSSESNSSFVESNSSFVEITPKQEPVDPPAPSTQIAALPPLVYVSSVEQSSSNTLRPILPKPQCTPATITSATVITPDTSETPTLQPAHAPPPEQRTDSLKAAKAILEENMKMNYEKLKQEREEQEHLLRVKLYESQIAVQEKILDILSTNPSSINLVVSGN